MTKILTMEKSLEDAIAIGFSAIEANDFYKVIRLLEYVKRYKNNYDEVMINYALLISYMNTQQTDEAVRIINEMDQLEIQNVQIAEVLRNIKKDLKLTNISQKKHSYEEIISNLEIQSKLHLLKDLYDLEGDESIWADLINPQNISSLRNRYQFYLLQLEKWNHLIIDFTEFSDKITPVDLFEFIKAIEQDYFFWFNFKSEHLAIILNNQELPTYVKNYVLERIAFFTKEKVLPIINITIPEIGDEITTYDLPVYVKKQKIITKEIMKIYLFDDAIDESTITTMIKSILDIIIISNYPTDMLVDVDKVSATASFIVNDIFMGREYDVLTAEHFGYKFIDLKSEIKQYERIITFLIT